MIRVLHKAFDILEYLAREAGNGRNLREISGSLAMNSGTCANILRTMVRREFIAQDKKRGPYKLGAMIYSLPCCGSEHGKLIFAAEPPVKDLVKKIRETALVAVLRGNERSIILQIDGNQSVQISPSLAQTNSVYITATGRMLLAHLGGKELEKFVLHKGLPGSCWNGTNSIKKLRSALSEIRNSGWAKSKTPDEVAGIACPIYKGGLPKNGAQKPIAALGVFLPEFRFKGAHGRGIIKAMAATASAIGKKLSGK